MNITNANAKMEKDIKSKKMSNHYSVKDGLAEFSVKDVDTVGRVVTGFYSTYNYMDSDGDVIVMGAAKKTISERGPLSQSVAKIKHALFHDLTRLPGKINVLEEKVNDGMAGIYFETKMSKTTEGMDTLQNYADGVYDNHSIGFRIMQGEWVMNKSEKWAQLLDSITNPKDAQEKEGVFIIKEIALYEGSTVSFGANTLTPFLGIKSENKEALNLAVFNRIEKINKTLKSGSQSDDMMFSLELQLMQLKQIFKELTLVMPKTIKDTERPSDAVDNTLNNKSIDLSYLTNNFKL